jgi:hypothetical protein
MHMQHQCNTFLSDLIAKIVTRFNLGEITNTLLKSSDHHSIQLHDKEMNAPYYKELIISLNLQPIADLYVILIRKTCIYF